MKLLSIVATFFCLISSLSAWTPPLGIPAPNWPTIGNPIEAVAPKPPDAWIQNMPSYYFVQTGGKNSGNGFPGNPTGRIPNVLPAGAKVFINGTYTWGHRSPYTILAKGTPDEPVWISSYDLKNPCKCTGSLRFRAGSAFAIVTDVNWDFSESPDGGNVGANGGDLGDGAGPQKAQYLCFRRGTIKGAGIIDPSNPNYTSGDRKFNSTLFYVNGEKGPGDARPTWDGCVEQVVLSNMLITQGGNWQYASGDPDGSGAVVGLFAQDVWVVDCEFSYFSGGCAGFGIGTPSTPDTDCTKRTYIGRNLAHHSAQAAFWSKRSQDCIFSENRIYGIRRDTPSMPNAPGLGGQYGPRNMWIIFNTIHDCSNGIRIEGGVGSTTPPISDTDVYIVGNLIYDIHGDSALAANTNWRTGDGNVGIGAGIHLRGGLMQYVINNTIHDTDAGIICPTYANNRLIEGNILSGRANHPLGADIYFAGDVGGLNTFKNNLIEGVNGSVWIKNAASTWTSIAQLNAAKGPGNISAAPNYRNSKAGDFTLLEGSSGVDAFGEIPNSVYAKFSSAFHRSIAFDRNGIPRPQNGVWDIGAFEYTDNTNPPTATPPITPGRLQVRPKK